MPPLETAVIVLAGIALFAAFINGALGYGFSSLTVPMALVFYTNRHQAAAFFHPALTRARGSMFTHFTPADLVAILNIPRLQTLPNSFKILREYRLSVVALVFSR